MCVLEVVYIALAVVPGRNMDGVGMKVGVWGGEVEVVVSQPTWQPRQVSVCV